MLSALVATSTASSEIVDIYDAAGLPKPSLSDLGPEFQLKAQSSSNPHLAIEALRALLVEESDHVTRHNLVRQRAFSERIAELMRALIGYAARALLRSDASPAGHRGEDLARQVPQEPAALVETSFPASWFRVRAMLALRGLAGEAEPASVHDFFTLTSVRAFRDLSEAERADRTRYVDQAVKELALT